MSIIPLRGKEAYYVGCLFTVKSDVPEGMGKMPGRGQIKGKLLQEKRSTLTSERLAEDINRRHSVTRGSALVDSINHRLKIFEKNSRKIQKANPEFALHPATIFRAFILHLETFTLY